MPSSCFQVVLCRILPIVSDHSCVKFTQAAFENPFEYIDREVTAQDIALYTKYLTGETETNENPALKVKLSKWCQ